MLQIRCQGNQISRWIENVFKVSDVFLKQCFSIVPDTDSGQEQNKRPTCIILDQLINALHSMGKKQYSFQSTHNTTFSADAQLVHHLPCPNHQYITFPAQVMSVHSFPSPSVQIYIYTPFQKIYSNYPLMLFGSKHLEVSFLSTKHIC